MFLPQHAVDRTRRQSLSVCRDIQYQTPPSVRHSWLL